MTTATNVTLAELVNRLESLPEDEQRYYASAIWELIDSDHRFDAKIESTPPQVMDRLIRDIDEDLAAGNIRPLNDADFALDDD